MADREESASFSANHDHKPIDAFYSEADDILQKFQELGKLIFKCIQIINGSSGMLKGAASKRVKLGDTIAGNNAIIDLKAFLEDLRTIHDQIYQGIRYVSRLKELKRRVTKIIKDKVWDTNLGELNEGELTLPTSWKEKIAKVAIPCSGGAVIGGAVTVGVTVGVALGLLFGVITTCTTAICGICIGFVALGTIGFGVGAGIGLLGIWVYDAVKIGKKRNESFIAFRDLEKHINETNLMPELSNFVHTLNAHCEGIISVAKLVSDNLVEQSPNSTVVSQTRRRPNTMYTVSSISSPIAPSPRVRSSSIAPSPGVRRDTDLLLPELIGSYRNKMVELGEKSPEMDDGVRHIVAMNVVVELCRYKLKNDGTYSNEEIEDFINHKLMPEFKP